ncbi:MAG: ethanolamine utilization protein EutN [Spirochaeta sp. LUC14_002_19_P3]|nr:MAG: ethanolamine utilization protein EutN [Spirochaeta sp. LUC14_002_19_P3]
MKIGKVIGRVVCEKKLECFQGKTLLLVQPLNEKGISIGTPLAAMDTVRAGQGDMVMYEGGKEAAMSIPSWFNPCDAAIIGIIDAL